MVGAGAGAVSSPFSAVKVPQEQRESNATLSKPASNIVTTSENAGLRENDLIKQFVADSEEFVSIRNYPTIPFTYPQQQNQLLQRDYELPALAAGSQKRPIGFVAQPVQQNPSDLVDFNVDFPNKRSNIAAPNETMSSTPHNGSVKSVQGYQASSRGQGPFDSYEGAGRKMGWDDSPYL